MLLFIIIMILKCNHYKIKDIGNQVGTKSTKLFYRGFKYLIIKANAQQMYLFLIQSNIYNICDTIYLNSWFNIL